MIEDDLRLDPLRFRIVAPRAREWTSFQKHRRADAWAIMQGEALDIEYDP